MIDDATCETVDGEHLLRRAKRVRKLEIPTIWIEVANCAQEETNRYSSKRYRKEGPNGCPLVLRC